MRLVYIYIDFTIGGKNPDGYRNYKKCGLNFGTEYYFNMSEPSEDKPNYELKCSARPAGERIEPGFWGNDRLYNISALVGDNGVGKTTLIHEIIRCLLDDSLKDNASNSLFAILMQDHEGEYHLQHTLSKPVSVCLDSYNDTNIGDALWRFENARKPYISKDSIQGNPILLHPLVERTKLIYFSNALTQSDKNLFETVTYASTNTWRENTPYSQPLYDCSLTADISNALRISNISDASFNKHLETYYNFRSYQEARYIFDRNQRQVLTEIKEQFDYPVPLPDTLSLHISPAFPHIISLYLDEDGLCRTTNEETFNIFCKEYEKHFRQCPRTKSLVTELCLNCIACFGEYIAKYWGKKYIQPEPPLADFSSRDFYFDFLTSMLPKLSKAPADLIKETENYYNNCYRYIDLLWNNFKNIDTSFQIIEKKRNSTSEYYVQCKISLGNNIDIVLKEFMIRFVNLTRAVSKLSYFVIYNWGLSSGESNLLHMFTKLRYLLSGSIYDIDTPSNTITEKNAGKVPLSKRDESLITCTESTGEVTCDSVILFIDEADLTLHPDWQRQFVAILATFLPKLFLDPYNENTTVGCHNIQIILGTHSPIMLGDFPAASVIYLIKTEDNPISVNDRNPLQPFGQNIYTILQNGFYLQKGTFGELTRQKIKSVLDDIHTIRHEDSEDPMKPDTAKRLMERLNSHLRLTVQYLPEGAIKNKLTEEISISKARLKGLIPCEDGYSTANLANTERIRQLEKENAELKYQLLKLQNKESMNDPN